MPTYRYTCVACGDFEIWQSIKADKLKRHECGEVCARVYTVPNLSITALPNKAQDARQTVATEKQWDRDMPAYKRLRMNGLQPKSIDGCGDLETRAQTKTEVERGRVSTLNRLLDREGLGT